MLNFIRKMSCPDHFWEHFFGPLQRLTAIILGLDVMWYIFFSIWVFLTQTFTNHRTVWEGGGHFFNSLLPLPPASQTLSHQSGDYCRELTPAQWQQPDWKQLFHSWVRRDFSFDQSLDYLQIYKLRMFKEGCSCAVQLHHVTKWGASDLFKKLLNMPGECINNSFH